MLRAFVHGESTVAHAVLPFGLRRVALSLVLTLAVCAPRAFAESVATLPAPTDYVSDFAGILSPQTVQQLDRLCGQLERQTHAQIAVVTVKSIDPDKTGVVPDIEDFAADLEQKWKVGPKASDRGLLFILSLHPRKYRFEVGYGLEGILNDAKVGDIGRQMAPYLHAGDYDRGVTLGIDEVAQDIAAGSGVTLDLAPPTAQQQADAAQPDAAQTIQISPVALALIALAVVAVLGVLIRTGNLGLLFFLLFNLFSGGRGGGWRGGGGGWSGGGGGDGDGFSGFGGGGSGGGGASGDF